MLLKPSRFPSSFSVSILVNCTISKWQHLYLLSVRRPTTPSFAVFLSVACNIQLSRLQIAIIAHGASYFFPDIFHCKVQVRFASTLMLIIKRPSLIYDIDRRLLVCHPCGKDVSYQPLHWKRGGSSKGSRQKREPNTKTSPLSGSSDPTHP